MPAMPLAYTRPCKRQRRSEPGSVFKFGWNLSDPGAVYNVDGETDGRANRSNGRAESRMPSGAFFGENWLDQEQSLIARSQRGDAQAYESLVREHEQAAFRAAYLITRDPHEAAEVAQDAFLRAFRALHTFKLGLPFRPWLLRIVTNLALNKVQAAQRRAKMTERYAQQVIAGQNDPAPDNLLEEREQNERLLDAVGRLSRDERSLISLRYFMGLPEAEVAEALSIPLGTVKSRLHRTLAKLKGIIQREFPDLEKAIGS